ncbi:nuclear transport factor 2 family protein [Maribacter sp. ACAM166]|uniref:nuclear transport factor 2 family protein n=1 Tax=Maribacter sp. ACAM166 TaxID=2508996 RepID=UPI0010FCFC36|nr:nuclear transport factor 2 family protein [Maribacter sp. ACAM166]TLP80244.1 nuclear transport factor 2 family protein [Maribacter sp. ACAM166]
MKKTILMLVMMTSLITFAQKKNGTVYMEHPAIDVAANFTTALVSGDTTKLASLLSDDFKAYNGVSTNPDVKGTEKGRFIKNSYRWFDELDYFSISDSPGAYPDAIEYKKDNENEEVWVQTWEMLKGVHKTTGVKLSSPIHRLIVVTKDNKIKMIINYFNDSIFDELGQSFSNRTNGTLYNHHDNINTVRKAMYAFENSDLDKAISYYSEDARFYNINDDLKVSDSKANVKAIRQKFLDAFQIKSIEMIGYPDYLEYEMGNGRSVLSWWDLHLIRKADKKEIVLSMHMNDDFDEDGKIISEMIYFNRALLEK